VKLSVGWVDKMIIPVRCMNCGYVLADKWRYYEERLVEERKGQKTSTIYIDGKFVPDEKKELTPEAKVFEELGINRYCCRKHLLTHVDLIKKN
jgi:DNA-directed RNA polymerase subunit N (RpoN/RPB10)